jgi:hypothetical protein
MLIEKIIETAQNFPGKLMYEITDMSKTLQLKMRKYSDSVNGRNNSDLMLAKAHMDFLNKLRINDPSKYTTLVYYAHIYPTLDIDAQPKATKSFLDSIGL